MLVCPPARSPSRRVPLFPFVHRHHQRYDSVPWLVVSPVQPTVDFLQKPGTPHLFVRVGDREPLGGNAVANSSMAHGDVNSTMCEEACSEDPLCVGLTLPNADGYKCWFYNYAPKTLEHSGADWLQKVETPLPPVGPPAPQPPSPPPPPGPVDPPCRPPPPELECTAWNKTAEWRRAGCDVNGTNCVLIIEVFAADDDDHASTTSGQQHRSSVSRNVLPFVPPKLMRLPATSAAAPVLATMSDTPNNADGNLSVDITLHASTLTTSLFVVLTTQAPGPVLRQRDADRGRAERAG